MPYKNAEVRKQYADKYNQLHPHKRRGELSANKLEQERSSARKRYKKNPEPAKVSSKAVYASNPLIHIKSDLKRRYGITLDQWNGLFESQQNLCAACGSDKPGSKNWNVDHDHNTSFIRGILCNSCNTALGLLKDDVNRILALAAYLQRTPDYEFEVI